MTILMAGKTPDDVKIEEVTIDIGKIEILGHTFGLDLRALDQIWHQISDFTYESNSYSYGLKALPLMKKPVKIATLNVYHCILYVFYMKLNKSNINIITK